MLTESQYKELIKFRNGDAEYNPTSSETMNFLTRKKYIIKYHPVSPNRGMSGTVMCAITEPGRQALEEYERYMREKSAEEEAAKIKEKAQRTANRLDMLTFGTAAAVIAGLIVYYWPSIISFFCSIFHPQ